MLMVVSAVCVCVLWGGGEIKGLYCDSITAGIMSFCHGFVALPVA